MLCRLIIRDFVLADFLELDFEAGFGALTGETGAGKSILIDALAFVLGERADAGAIRSGCKRAEICAEFDLTETPEVAEWLREREFAGDDGLLLRRIVDLKGRSRAYINGSPAIVQQLREVAESLVDIHGQHAHQSLLRAEAQRELLDSHAGLGALVKEVAAAWRQWREAKSLLEQAADGADAIAKEREQLEWQAGELDSLAFSLDEWESLNVEHKRLAHAAGLVEGAQFSLAALTDGDSACEQQIAAVVSRLDGLSDYDPALAEVASVLQSAQAELADAISALRRYADRVELDPQRLSEIERRIEAVHDCARKFRTTPEKFPVLLGKWRERLAVLGESADISALESRVRSSRGVYEELAGDLSKKRAEAAEALGGEVSRVMKQLALGAGRLEVALSPLDAGAAYGFEQVEFRVSGLSGNESRSLAKVVSGGELSRISLAIQVVTSQAARVPTLIFDEVDVGIGGGVAEVVGRLLRELGGARQVVCVTHLPQVAARANWQWQVVKDVEDGKMRSRVLLLSDDDRVEEIARMLGGMAITPITRQHAREMLLDS